MLACTSCAQASHMHASACMRPCPSPNVCTSLLTDACVVPRCCIPPARRRRCLFIALAALRPSCSLTRLAFAARRYPRRCGRCSRSVVGGAWQDYRRAVPAKDHSVEGVATLRGCGRDVLNEQRRGGLLLLIMPVILLRHQLAAGWRGGFRCCCCCCCCGPDGCAHGPLAPHARLQLL
jgi:hypothetical protein